MEIHDYREREIKTSKREVQDLLKAWFFFSLAFTILYNGLNFNLSSLVLFVMFGFTVGLGFLMHELSHKVVAQRFGYKSEFVAFDHLLWLSLLGSFLGFIFAAPGGVFIEGRVSREENGKISAAGPFANLVIALLFLIGYALSPIFAEFFYHGFRINSWFGLFNLFPFGNFDGIKILRWNKRVYFSMVAAGLIFMFI